ncbi:hypothetical protein [Paraburkholderia phenoliruptrix]|uniref:hypothetical protein n=1 Tax=Paraburkholderia phenoliruptrix TaxID=252970 RepID=UPI0035A8942B
MYDWRKLFIVFLLALSLPVQSFAAVAMKCAAGPARESEPAHQHVVQPEQVALHADLHRHAAPRVDHLQADGHQHGGAHAHAHACSTCASCCFGAAMLSVPALPSSTRIVDSFEPAPHSTPAASFLTGGIERPPRSIPV